MSFLAMAELYKTASKIISQAIHPKISHDDIKSFINQLDLVAEQLVKAPLPPTPVPSNDEEEEPQKKAA